MPKFIMVMHNWFVDCKGFDVKELEAENYEHAYAQACVIKNRKHGTFNSCNFVVIKVKEGEQIDTGRKLSPWERITGRIKK